MRSDRTLKLAIAALGGQGAGVLTDWLIHAAECEDHLVQSTSVPGVAQRTGATIYYLEFYSRAAAEMRARDPVMALMPAAGDVDCVIASELAEAGRTIQRGLVTSDRTTLIASSHRAYTISERSALGDGVVDSQQLRQLCAQSAQRLILFDMEQLAEKHGSYISAVLLGAIAGARVLPFKRESFEQAIRSSEVAIEANLRAFAAALDHASSALSQEPLRQRSISGEIPVRAARTTTQPLLDRIRTLPASVQPTALEGVRRLIDYQDPDYASRYLDRVEEVARADHDTGARLTQLVAQHLALWMSFEDTVRVADLKTRATRFERVRAEIRPQQSQLLRVTEFMMPRVEEIAGTLPAVWGRWILSSGLASRSLSRLTGGKHIRTTTISGFLLLRLIASLRRFRRATLRYHIENERIEHWLVTIRDVAGVDYGCAMETARLQRLVKGYGDTHERGFRHYSLILGHVRALKSLADGAATLARLQAAALADEDGHALRRELASLPAA